MGAWIRTWRGLAVLGGLVIVTAGSLVVWRTHFKLYDDCPITPATEADFAEATAVGDGVFEPELWELRMQEHPALISVGWFYEKALAHSQYVMFNCGYNRADMNRLYGQDGIAIMMGGYKSWKQTATCEKDGITLREFDVVYDDQGDVPYKVRFWVQPINETRVRDVRLDMPAGDTEMMDTYATRLFPEIASCENF